MDLYIIRHAWAGHFGDPQWPDDSMRPLTEKGKKRFAEMAGILAGAASSRRSSPPVPCCVAGKRRKFWPRHLAGRAEVVEQKELLPEGDFEGLWAWTSEQARHHGQIAWVGHCPQVNQYAAALIGLSDGSIRFSKGAVAAIRFDDDLTPSEGELQWLATAKLLGI